MLQHMFKERYHPRRNEFLNKRIKNLAQSKVNKRNESILHDSGAFTSWQNPPPSHPPMNWVPMAQFPNIQPLGQQGFQLQRPAQQSGISMGTQRTLPNSTKPSLSYKQVLNNQQNPANQQCYPSHFLPSYQVAAPLKNVRHFR